MTDIGLRGTEGRAAALWSGLRARASHRLAMHVQAEPFRLQNTAPLVSFTFDDAPRSALINGGKLLAEYGAHGTFYVSGSLVGTRDQNWEVISREDVSTLRRDGHEVGCHTYGHLPASSTSTQQMLREIDRNLAFFRSIDPSAPVENFAFPYGHGSLSLKRRLRGRFTSSRSIIPGINHGCVDLQFLHAMPLIDRQMTPGAIDRALDRTVQDKGWLIFYTHDVVPRPSPYGCSPALLAYALAAAAARGIACEPVRDALRKVGAQSPTRTAGNGMAFAAFNTNSNDNA